MEKQADRYFLLCHEDFIADSVTGDTITQHPEGVNLEGFKRLYTTADTILAEAIRLFPDYEPKYICIQIFHNAVPRVFNTAALLMEIIREKGFDSGREKISENINQPPPITEEFVAKQIDKTLAQLEGRTCVTLCVFVSHQYDIGIMTRSAVGFGDLFLKEK